MTDRDKVITDITSVVADMQEEVDEWKDYSDSELSNGLTCDCDWWYKALQTLKDSLALLREQEPRVMTVEELCRARGKPAWFEARNGRLYTGWVLIYDVQTGLGITGTRVGVTEPGHVTIWPNVELYGQKWRCWTGEPTEEQRRATAWN